MNILFIIIIIQGSSEEDLERPKAKPSQYNSTSNSNSIQNPVKSQTITHQKESLSKFDLHSNHKNAAKANDDLNIDEKLDLNDDPEKGSSNIELSAIETAANEMELSAVVDDIFKVQNRDTLEKDSSVLEISAIEKANDVHHASEEEFNEDPITAANGVEVRSNNVSFNHIFKTNLF